MLQSAIEHGLTAKKMTRQYKKNRKYYGYDKLEVGQGKRIECADFDDMVTARTAAYMCARKYGRKFETTFERVDEKYELIVTRIK